MTIATDPGELLQSLLDEHGVSQALLVYRTGMSAKHVNQMVRGRARISAEVAVEIEAAVPGISAESLLLAQMKKDLREARSRRSS